MLNTVNGLSQLFLGAGKMISGQSTSCSRGQALNSQHAHNSSHLFLFYLQLQGSEAPFCPKQTSDQQIVHRTSYRQSTHAHKE